MIIVKILIVIIVMSIIFVVWRKYSSENFSQNQSENSMPLLNNSSVSGITLFLNFYRKNGNDFKLFDYIKKLRLDNLQTSWSGLYLGSNRNVFKSNKLSPIIIVPGLGATPIFAKWNKTSSTGTKITESTGKFEKSDIWSCVQTQDEWVKVWEPNFEEDKCWSDVLSVLPETDMISDSEGTITSTGEFGSLDFVTVDYMETLVESLESKGYTKSENLFGAGYDFRKIGSENEISLWCEKMKNLIEVSCSEQGNPAIIIAHDLGSLIANYFLVNGDKKWKDKYIKSFVTVSGTFGGSPRALRTIISGCNNKNLDKVLKNFSGLHMMLPVDKVYGDNPLVYTNGKSYTSSDVPKIIKGLSEDLYKIYEISKKVVEKSMLAPGVTTYILAGDNLDTESSYDYGNSLFSEPKVNQPFYQIDSPASQTFNYPDYFIGDGTMPKFALEYPIFWTKDQKEPINFHFFEGIEHTDILSTYEFIKYMDTVL
jgi:lysophospholipase-3